MCVHAHTCECVRMWVHMRTCVESVRFLVRHYHSSPYLETRSPLSLTVNSACLCLPLLSPPPRHGCQGYELRSSCLPGSCTASTLPTELFPEPCVVYASSPEHRQTLLYSCHTPNASSKLLVHYIGTQPIFLNEWGTILYKEGSVVQWSGVRS